MAECVRTRSAGRRSSGLGDTDFSALFAGLSSEQLQQFEAIAPPVQKTRSGLKARIAERLTEKKKVAATAPRRGQVPKTYCCGPNRPMFKEHLRARLERRVNALTRTINAQSRVTRTSSRGSARAAAAPPPTPPRPNDTEYWRAARSTYVNPHPPPPVPPAPTHKVSAQTSHDILAAYRTRSSERLATMKSSELLPAVRTRSSERLAATKSQELPPASRTRSSERLAATKSQELPPATRTRSSDRLAASLAAARQTSGLAFWTNSTFSALLGSTSVSRNNSGLALSSLFGQSGIPTARTGSGLGSNLSRTNSGAVSRSNSGAASRSNSAGGRASRTNSQTEAVRVTRSRSSDLLRQLLTNAEVDLPAGSVPADAAGLLSGSMSSADAEILSQFTHLNDPAVAGLLEQMDRFK